MAQEIGIGGSTNNDYGEFTAILDRKLDKKEFTEQMFEKAYRNDVE